MNDDNVLLLELTAGDRASPTWQKLMRYFEAHLANCRSKNDGNLPELETASLRGRIAVYKGLIALNEDRAPQD